MLATGKRVLLLTAVLVILIYAAVSAGEFWQFGEYNKTSETFRYKITTNKYSTTYSEEFYDDEEYDEYSDGDMNYDEEYGEADEGDSEEYAGEGAGEDAHAKEVETTISFYEVTISRENGKMHFAVSNEWDVSEEEFYRQNEMERLVSFYYGQYFNLPMMNMAGMLASNSMMFLMSVENLELEVGMMMSTWDGGLIRVTGKETMAGQEGYVCEYSVKAEDENGKTVRKKVSEWVIAPTISMPLSTRVFNENTGEMLTAMELIDYSAVE